MDSNYDYDPDGYTTTSRTEADQEELYTDMDSGIQQCPTDADGYSETERSHVKSDDQMPTDSDGYLRTHGMHPECDELYADMESNHGDLYVDVSRNDSEEMYMNEQDLYHSQGIKRY